MKSPVHLRHLDVLEVPPLLPAEDSFSQRQAAHRHHRRSRRIRSITAAVLWTLVLLLISGFLVVEVITVFKLA